jgi:hypothetical protein
MFSRTIRSLSKLRTLNLTVVKVPGDESMSDGAVRIARANPRLREFSIRYIPRNYNDQSAPHLPRTTDQPTSIFEFRRFLEIGKFELTCDGHGLPVTLYGREWKERLKLEGWTSWTSSLVLLPVELTARMGSGIRSLSRVNGANGFTRLVKRYQRDMRPPGHPGVTKLGLVQLMVDGGAAGRELRMLVFSMALVVISTGAIFVQ